MSPPAFSRLSRLLEKTKIWSAACSRAEPPANQSMFVQVDLKRAAEDAAVKLMFRMIKTRTQQMGRQAS